MILRLLALIIHFQLDAVYKIPWFGIRIFLNITRTHFSMNMNTPPISPNGSPFKSASSHDVLWALAKRKWLYLFLILFSGAFSFWLMKFQLFEYSSQASFYISDNSVGASLGQNEELKFNDGVNLGEQFNRAYLLVNSTEVYNHLIKKFNLIKHYQIDTTKEFYYEKALDKLSKSILIKKTPYNLIAVTVSDKYRYMAADMANEILAYLDKVNKSIAVKSLNRKLELYSRMIKNTQVDNEAKTTLFNNQMTEMNHLLSRLEKQPTNSIAVLDLQSKLSGLMNAVDNSTNELIRMRLFYSLAVQSIQENNLPSVIVVKEARPSHQSIGWQSLLASGLIMLLLLSTIIFSVYFKLRYHHYFQILMSKDQFSIDQKSKQKQTL